MDTIDIDFQNNNTHDLDLINNRSLSIDYGNVEVNQPANDLRGPTLPICKYW